MEVVVSVIISFTMEEVKIASAVPITVSLVPLPLSASLVILLEIPLIWPPVPACLDIMMME